VSAAVAVLTAAGTADAAEQQFSYSVRVDATASGDNFVPREPQATTSGSLSASWSATWQVVFGIDRTAGTVRVTVAQTGLADAAITSSLTETADDGAGSHYTCSFAGARSAILLQLDNAAGGLPSSSDYARGAVELYPNVTLPGQFPTRFPCGGSPARDVGPSELSIPGITQLCRGPFRVPLDRLGQQHVVLQSDPGPLSGCPDPLGFGTYTGHVSYTVTLDLATGPPPDLVIRRLMGTGEVVKVGRTLRRVWRVRAVVANDGRGDVTGESGLLLEGARVEDFSTTPVFRALGTVRLPPLAANASTTVEWVAGAPGPNVVDFDEFSEANLLRVTADAGDAVPEVTKENNRRRLWKLRCDAVSAPAVWVEVAEEGDRTRLSPPDYGAALDALPERTPEQKARAVLCYIQLEAERRAKSPSGTIAGSRFENQLATHFLADYLRSPSPEAGRRAADGIGEAAGGVLKRALPVPKGARKVYPGVPANLYPATEFLATISYYRPIVRNANRPGKNHRFIPYIDGPFLVGDPNLRKGVNDDFGAGGRNHTNVMHWATGVKYGDLRGDAFRALFIGYELFHLEGWEVFGEDSINDLIGEESGRLLGRRLLQGTITSHAGLIAALDADFREARAWVGAMLRLRRDRLDDLILEEKPPEALFHWKKKERMAPWEGKTIAQRLEGGGTVRAVRTSHFVDRLIQIYTLIYEADEWQRANGALLTPLVKDIVNGVYDSQFRAQKDKRFFDTWDIHIRRH
jgi:hypothetical protein